MDLANAETLPAKVERLLTHHNALRRGLGEAEIAVQTILDELTSVADRILPFRETVWKLLDEARSKGSRILFEGAQGTLLDIDHGTYPFVTSSNTVAGQAAAGSGMGPGALNFVLGITKAYTTRVGEGPFPTELHDAVGQGLGERGREFGTVTGRSRRCGWFDAALVCQSVAVNGITGIALTKLDILDGMDEIKICTGYRLDGEGSPICLPARARRHGSNRFMNRSMDGKARRRAHGRGPSFPRRPSNMCAVFEELIGAPIALLSTSPERDDTILVADPFRD